jgi:hypothetical protein
VCGDDARDEEGFCAMPRHSVPALAGRRQPAGAARRCPGPAGAGRCHGSHAALPQTCSMSVRFQSSFNGSSSRGKQLAAAREAARVAARAAQVAAAFEAVATQIASRQDDEQEDGHCNCAAGDVEEDNCVWIEDSSDEEGAFTDEDDDEEQVCTVMYRSKWALHTLYR